MTSVNQTRTGGRVTKIIYWIATLWLALGMTSTGIVQLLKVKEETAMMKQLGYPEYFLTLLGTWKILGVIAVLVPKFPLLKEWAYAGFFFAMSGAIFSHAAMGNGIKEFFGPALLLVLTVVSWYFRPAERKFSLTKS
ncbi:MAG TPA: DoxX family protein [Cyclobacteriaceae bacterium]|nr:DoxX family protein [Cyclobacteriaceae bacterium]